MSLDNLPATQTVTAPNTQTIISLAVPGTGRLLRTSLARQRWRRSRGGGGGGSNCTGTAGCGSLGSVRVKTCSVCVTDRPDAQSNLHAKGTKLTTPTVPAHMRLKPGKSAAISDPPTPTRLTARAVKFRHRPRQRGTRSQWQRPDLSGLVSQRFATRAARPAGRPPPPGEGGRC